mgnify:CR=1 FL=1
MDKPNNAKLEGKMIINVKIGTEKMLSMEIGHD